MQNAECRMQNEEAEVKASGYLPVRILHSSFCILHFFSSRPSPRPLPRVRGRGRRAPKSGAKIDVTDRPSHFPVISRPARHSDRGIPRRRPGETGHETGHQARQGRSAGADGLRAVPVHLRLPAGGQAVQDGRFRFPHARPRGRPAGGRAEAPDRPDPGQHRPEGDRHPRERTCRRTRARSHRLLRHRRPAHGRRVDRRVAGPHRHHAHQPQRHLPRHPRRHRAVPLRRPRLGRRPGRRACDERQLQGPAPRRDGAAAGRSGAVQRAVRPPGRSGRRQRRPLLQRGRDRRAGTAGVRRGRRRVHPHDPGREVGQHALDGAVRRAGARPAK